jgi:N-dimethylarginine dimethylaminohydrolase
MWNVKARYDTLKIAIVEPGRMERWWATPVNGEYPIAWGCVDLPYHTHFTKLESDLQRRDLQNTMQNAVKRELPSVRLLTFRQLLQETLDEYREDESKVRDIVMRCFHEWDRSRVEKLIGGNWSDVTAAQIIGSDSPPLIKDGDDFKVGIRPTPWVQNISEEGWMTDQGWVYCNKKTWWRSREDEITHAIVENHPEFIENVNVLLDLKPPAYMEGGDLRAPSEDTIAGGVGWHTNLEAMRQISEALPEKTVYAVQKADISQEDFTDEVYDFGWHFETFHCEVDKGKGLFLPYMNDYPKGGRKKFIEWLKALKRDIEEWHPLLRKLREKEIEVSPEEKKRIKENALKDLTDEKIATLQDVGKVYTFKKGKLVSKRDSYLQALIDDGVMDEDGIIWYGGDPDWFENPLEHLTSLAGAFAAKAEIAECLSPGVVLVFEEAENTIKSLEEHGCRAVTYSAFYQRKTGGPGPDCSFCPLHRE